MASRVARRAGHWLWQRSEKRRSGLSGELLQRYRQWYSRRGLVVEPVVAGQQEVDDAKDYWSQIGVRDFYGRDSHWSTYMGSQAKLLEPTSVLEFGCNTGRNLLAIRKAMPDVTLKGIDINAKAVAHGRDKFGLDLMEADESFLAAQPDGAYDVAFTISVLDHVPDPKPILEELVRVAKKAVLLLEPDTGTDGKVVHNMNARTGYVGDTTPYSYSWNLVEMAKSLSVRIVAEPYILEGTNLGQHYQFIRLLKDN